MVLTDYLSAIADAIRSKDGSTEAIPAKDFPQRILNIPSGGSGGSSGSGESGDINLAFGRFTPTQNTTTVTVAHGLNVIPNFAVVYVIDDVSTFSVAGLSILVSDFTASNGYKHYETRSEWKNIKTIVSNEQSFVYSATDVVFNLNDAPFWSGKNYEWILGRLGE